MAVAAGCVLLSESIQHLNRPLTPDETSSWRTSGYRPLECVQHCAANVHPPLYFVVLRAWRSAFGSSAAAMRTLSLVLFLVALSITVLLFQAEEPAQAEVSPPWRTGILAAVQFSVSPLQRELALTARMYQLAVLLAALSSLLMLCGLRGGRGSVRCWVGYAAVAAALCYTHNFGLFTVASQASFAALEAVRSLWGKSPHWRNCIGCAVALSAVATLYSPWLPVLRAQGCEVARGYWIPSITADTVARVFSSWATGASLVVPWSLSAGFLIAILAVILRTAANQRLGRFFLIQAIVPWILCITVSVVSGTSILQDRYLTCAQWGWCCLLALTLDRLSKPWTGIGRAMIIVTCVLMASTTPDWKGRPDSGFREAVKVLCRSAQSGDLVLVHDTDKVNLLLFHAQDFGSLHCRVGRHSESLIGSQHIPHLASLHADDFITPADLAECRRIWLFFNHTQIVDFGPPGTRRVYRREWMAPDFAALELYVRTTLNADSHPGRR